jgi:signal transduction histidine kinase
VAGEELRRTARIVAQLRDLYRQPDAARREPVDVNEVLERVLVVNQPRAREQGVEVEWQPAAGLPALPAVAGQLQQVFLNLLLNAVEAMPRGGRVRIRSEAVEEPAGVRVRFEDNGPGIAEHVLARIFEPFYSTRPDGLGLGLFISHNIVAEHGGTIDVHSRLGEGTTFTVWLPAE